MLSEAVALHGLSSRTFLALAPLIVLVLGLVLYSLIDIARHPDVRLLPRPAWAVIVVAVSMPLGALAYLVWGRNRERSRNAGFSPDELAELAAFEATADGGPGHLPR